MEGFAIQAKCTFICEDLTISTDYSRIGMYFPATELTTCHRL